MKIKGIEFKPREPYTHRIRKILEEYPDGSQVLREILQNSDNFEIPKSSSNATKILENIEEDQAKFPQIFKIMDQNPSKSSGQLN